MEEMIKRINRLAQKKRKEGLTPEELKEQKELYAVYLHNIREQVRAQLEARIDPSRPQECGCSGEHHHHDGECRH